MKPGGTSNRQRTLPSWSHSQMAARLARDIPDGAVVNLGIGLPTLVAEALSPEREIILHSENGILGMGPAPKRGAEDFDLINAGKQPVTLLPGGSFFHHADSFAMMRGGHIDISVMGALQVSVKGDLANWHTGNPESIPAVGGAMDLATGSAAVYVLMEHLDRNGCSKLVEKCTYPLTAAACVNRIYTNFAVLVLTPLGMRVVERVPGLEHDDLVQLTGIPLQ